MLTNSSYPHRSLHFAGWLVPCHNDGFGLQPQPPGLCIYLPSGTVREDTFLLNRTRLSKTEISRFPLRHRNSLPEHLRVPLGKSWAKKRPQPPLGKLRPIILARTYSHTECYRTTIGGWGLNERVRNGNGCFPPPMFTRVVLTYSRIKGERLHVMLVMVRV